MVCVSSQREITTVVAASFNSVQLHHEFRTSKSRDNQRKRRHIKMTAVDDIHLVLQTE